MVPVVGNLQARITVQGGREHHLLRAVKGLDSGESDGYRSVVRVKRIDGSLETLEAFHSALMVAGSDSDARRLTINAKATTDPELSC